MSTWNDSKPLLAASPDRPKKLGLVFVFSMAIAIGLAMLDYSEYRDLSVNGVRATGLVINSIDKSSSDSQNSMKQITISVEHCECQNPPKQVRMTTYGAIGYSVGSPVKFVFNPKNIRHVVPHYILLVGLFFRDMGMFGIFLVVAVIAGGVAMWDVTNIVFRKS